MRSSVQLRAVVFGSLLAAQVLEVCARGEPFATAPPQHGAEINEKKELDQLRGVEEFSDYELVVRLEIEMLCIANPEDRPFLLSYYKRQFLQPSAKRSRWR